jgi:hypothetical protein
MAGDWNGCSSLALNRLAPLPLLIFRFFSAALSNNLIGQCESHTTCFSSNTRSKSHEIHDDSGCPCADQHGRVCQSIPCSHARTSAARSAACRPASKRRQSERQSGWPDHAKRNWRFQFWWILSGNQRIQLIRTRLIARPLPLQNPYSGLPAPHGKQSVKTAPRSSGRRSQHADAVNLSDSIWT